MVILTSVYFSIATTNTPFSVKIINKEQLNITHMTIVKLKKYCYYLII